MKHLLPCPECNRHVRVSELECPFCALPLELANTPPPQLPRGRLSRAATLAFGATLVSATALSACSGDAEATGVPSNAGAAGSAAATSGTAGGGTIYVPGAAGESGESGAGGDANNGGKGGGPVAVYGGPP